MGGAFPGRWWWTRGSPLGKRFWRWPTVRWTSWGGTVEVEKRSRPGPGVEAAFRAAAFTYEPERDVYRCPNGQELGRRGTEHARVGVLHHVYQAGSHL
jgi:hypothetical protein